MLGKQLTCDDSPFRKTVDGPLPAAEARCVQVSPNSWTTHLCQDDYAHLMDPIMTPDGDIMKEPAIRPSHIKSLILPSSRWVFGMSSHPAIGSCFSNTAMRSSIELSTIFLILRPGSLFFRNIRLDFWWVLNPEIQNFQSLSKLSPIQPHSGILYILAWYTRWQNRCTYNASYQKIILCAAKISPTKNVLRSHGRDNTVRSSIATKQLTRPMMRYPASSGLTSR